MTLNMMNAGEKSVVADVPTYVVTSQETKPRGEIQKKHVLITVGLVVVVGLIITGILVGMYIFSDAQKEIVKFSLDFKSSQDGQNTKQDVESDPNDNSVIFHINKNGQDVYIVNDFNRDMQIVKVQTSENTNCYISALNRSAAYDPSHITGSNSLTGSGGKTEQMYTVSNSPVSDRSFLPKKALDMCKGISVYWAYRSCAGLHIDPPTNGTDVDRNRRTIYAMQPYHGLPGLGGCCYAYYACRVQMTETIQGYYHTCQTYVWTNYCCGSVAYPYCQNAYRAYWKTPGLVC
jgi:hypothetical protein